MILKIKEIDLDSFLSIIIPAYSEHFIEIICVNDRSNDSNLNTTPPNVTYWSTRSIAKAQGISEATIRRIWKKHNLKPHLTKTFKLSNDKHFAGKLYDIVGLLFCSY